MGKKILVADDSPTKRKVAESLLKKQGYEVLCAEDGASALGMAKTHQPDLIFLDESLPILDGTSVCQELKRNNKLKDIPVIMLLTTDEAEKKSQLKGMGADAFMVKPLNPKDILEKVEKFLKKEKNSLRDKMRTDRERKKSKNEPVSGDDKLNTDETDVPLSSSKKSEKSDELLDIIETCDFLESLEAPHSDAKEPHGFEWFMSEMKKEMEKPKEVDLSVEQRSREKLNSKKIDSSAPEDLRKKDQDEKKSKVHQIDKDQKGFEDFLNELKGNLEEPEVEKSLDHQIPTLDYDRMMQALIDSISTKIAQEVVKKLDPEILKQMVRDEVEKLRKEGIKAK